MHDAHLGHAFLFLDLLAEYASLSMTVMATPCLWYVVGMKLEMSYVKFPKPLLQAPLLASAEFSSPGLTMVNKIITYIIQGIIHVMAIEIWQQIELSKLLLL